MIPFPAHPVASELRTVFLDRDGVLNQKAPEGAYVSRWEEFRMLPGVPQAIACLNRSGLRVILVSNQRGVARGLYTAADVEALHARLAEELKLHGAHIDAFFICPHDIDQCNCRKPLTGLYEHAAARFPGISPATSVMIGDSSGDIEFGRRLGMATILIERAPEPGSASVPVAADLRAVSLLDAVEMLLGPC